MLAKRGYPQSCANAHDSSLCGGSLWGGASCKELLLGYDVFVKDDPASPEWIFYNSLSEPVSLKETDMLRVLDRTAAEHGLSYTESCFDRLDGKSMKKEKPAL